MGQSGGKVGCGPMGKPVLVTVPQSHRSAYYHPEGHIQDGLLLFSMLFPPLLFPGSSFPAICWLALGSGETKS